MVRQKQLFTAILLISLLFSPWGGVKAQQRDRISNFANYGAYTGGNDQNVIINNDNTAPINPINPNPNDIVGNSEGNFVGGFGNVAQDAKSSLLYGSNNSIEEFDNGVAIGKDNLVGGIIPGEDSYAIGKRLNPILSESMALGFGAEENRLNGIGERAITIGTYSANAGEAFNTLNVLPPSRVTLFEAPGVGIGTAEPQGKLNIVNRGATEGENGELGVALNVQKEVEFITPGLEPGPIPIPDRRDDLFNVRDDGAAGFNIPANPGRPRAPYQFEESQSSPFGNGQGRANIVQNYSNFPEFEDCCPPDGGNNDEAKWLALGERPPGAGNARVAYGLANVWDNNAGNFVLLDQTPDDEQETDDKDLAITFQDVWNQDAGEGELLTDPENAGNRIRFLFRNANQIQQNNSTFELMSLEPTGEVGVGDYSNSTQEANLEVKAETQGNGDPVFQVRNNGGPGSRGDGVFTVRDDDIVIVNKDSRILDNMNNPVNDEFQVNGSGASTSGFSQVSDSRVKKDTTVIKNPLKKVQKLNGVTYLYHNKNEKAKGLKFPEKRQAGVLAQQLKEVLPEAVSGSKEGLYLVNYDQIIPLLIETNKAQQKQIEKQKEQIQKQQKQIEELQAKTARVEKLEQQVEKLSNQLSRLKDGSNGSANRFKNNSPEDLNERTVAIGNEDTEKQAMLLQNRPNPYSNETVIPYYLPEDFNQANMLITDINGQLIKRVSLEKSGKGELTLRTGSLKAGKYIYSLVVDGKQVESRKMVVKSSR